MPKSRRNHDLQEHHEFTYTDWILILVLCTRISAVSENCLLSIMVWNTNHFFAGLFCCNIIETELLFTAPSNFAISPICQIILAMRLTPLSGSDIRLQFFHDPIWAQNLIQIYLIWFWPGYFCCRAMKKGFNVEQTMKRGNTSINAVRARKLIGSGITLLLLWIELSHLNWLALLCR